MPVPKPKRIQNLTLHNASDAEFSPLFLDYQAGRGRERFTPKWGQVQRVKEKKERGFSLFLRSAMPELRGLGCYYSSLKLAFGWLG